MIPFKSKLAAALNLLASSGISKLSYAPIGYRLLWHVGVPIPPPHFLTLFGAIAMNAISLFLIFFGLTLALSDNPDSIVTLQAGLIAGVLGASLFAPFPAALTRYRARRHKIPLWREFEPNVEGGDYRDA